MGRRVGYRYSNGAVKYINLQTGNYTLTPADGGKRIILTSGTAKNLTVPSGVLVDNFHCEVEQGGAGTISIINDGTSVLHSLGSLFNIAGQYGVARIQATAPDVFTVSGDLA